MQRQDGPCLDCWRSGEAVREDHLAGAVARWPHFAPPALSAGFASAYAVPMRLRDERLGALGLFAGQPCGLAGPGETVAKAMADVATIGILRERFIRQREEVPEQLQVALNTRVVLAQVKGVIAEGAGIGVDEALALLRHYARHHNLLLSEVARRVIGRDLAARGTGSPCPRHPPPLSARGLAGGPGPPAGIPGLASSRALAPRRCWWHDRS